MLPLCALTGEALYVNCNPVVAIAELTVVTDTTPHDDK